MIVFLYNLLLILGSPLWVPWMLRRSAQRAERVDWRQRFGYLPTLSGPRKRIWMHAVSVGEVIACLPILRELRRDDVEIILSVTTSSGHQTARTQAKGLYDHLVYPPIDLPWMTRRALRRVRPDVLAIMETELWLNLLRSAKSVGTRTCLVNGRISDRSFPRSLKIKFYYQALFRSLDVALVQTDVDAERLTTLGATNVRVTGNVKFDQAADGTQDDPSTWRHELGLTLPTVVVGSLRAEEFAEVAPALVALGVRYQVIVAPRHIERTPDLAALLNEPRIRSQGDRFDGPGCLILDTYGELSAIYAVADVVVIGGGFANLGGQNILQPLAHGKPVLHGPHMQNFRDVAQQAQAAGASETCPPAELADRVTALLEDPDRRSKMSKLAADLVQRNLGAATRDADAIRALL